MIACYCWGLYSTPLNLLLFFFIFQLSCCGVNSYEDWDNNIYFNCSGPANNPEACGVPFSCCIPDQAVRFYKFTT